MMEKEVVSTDSGISVRVEEAAMVEEDSDLIMVHSGQGKVREFESGQGKVRENGSWSGKK